MVISKVVVMDNNKVFVVEGGVMCGIFVIGVFDMFIKESY